MTNQMNMNVLEWLNQGTWWIDVPSNQVVPLVEMNEGDRLEAARWLIRHATAVISMAENRYEINGDLMAALTLSSRNPKNWIQGTPLYGALYRSNGYGERVPAPSPSEFADHVASLKTRRG